MRCATVFGSCLLAVASIAGLAGCSVTINGPGSAAYQSHTPGAYWSGSGVEMSNALPDRYTGRFLVGADGISHPDGYGVYTTPGGEVWEGEFKGGQLNGHGVHRLPSGFTEDGNWKDGELDGHGRESGPSGTALEVEYRGGEKIRQEGTVVYDDKTRQVGKWTWEDERGSGTIDWTDGRHYEGEWRNLSGRPDLPDGKGMMRWPDGRVYEGSFRDGLPDGMGKMTEAGGKVVEGEWKRGEAGEVMLICEAAGALAVNVRSLTGWEVLTKDRVIGGVGFAVLPAAR